MYTPTYVYLVSNHALSQTHNRSCFPSSFRFVSLGSCSKAVARQDTTGWIQNCHTNYTGIDQCRLGFPWPAGAEKAGIEANKDGWLYNCYVNEKVETYWGPRLREKLKAQGWMTR